MAQERKRRGPGFFDRDQQNPNVRAFMRGNFAGMVLTFMVVQERTSMSQRVQHLFAMDMIFLNRFESFSELTSFSIGFLWGVTVSQNLFFSEQQGSGLENASSGPGM